MYHVHGCFDSLQAICKLYQEKLKKTALLTSSSWLRCLVTLPLDNITVNMLQISRLLQKSEKILKTTAGASRLVL